METLRIGRLSFREMRRKTVTSLMKSLSEKTRPKIIRLLSKLEVCLEKYGVR